MSQKFQLYWQHHSINHISNRSLHFIGKHHAEVSNFSIRSLKRRGGHPSLCIRPSHNFALSLSKCCEWELWLLDTQILEYITVPRTDSWYNIAEICKTQVDSVRSKGNSQKCEMRFSAYPGIIASPVSGKPSIASSPKQFEVENN